MRRFALAAAVLSLSGVASAQQSQNPMSYEALAKSKAGQWAEYTMSKTGEPQTIKMKYALVQKTDKQMALELDSQTPMGPVLMHMQFDAAPGEWKVSKVRAQLGGGPAQDVPAASLGGQGIKKGELPGKLVGTESVKTPAGTFECKHYTKTVTAPGSPSPSQLDVWMNDKAMPTGLVKMADAHGAQAVLTAMGSDAKPKMDMSKPAPTMGAPAGAGGGGAGGGGGGGGDGSGTGGGGGHGKGGGTGGGHSKSGDTK